MIADETADNREYLARAMPSPKFFASLGTSDTLSRYLQLTSGH